MKRPPETALLPDGFVDLWEAIGIAGRIQFGDDWTGEETDSEWDWRYRDNLESCAERERDGLLKALAGLGDSLEGIDEHEALEMCKARFLKEDTERNWPRQRREDVAVRLRQLLYDGLITAKAVLPSGRTIEIHDFVWAGENAQRIFETGVVCVENREVQAPSSKAHPCELAYVLLLGTEVETAMTGQAARRTTQSLKPALDKCTEWLIERMSEDPNNPPEGGKKRIRKDALGKFRGLSGRGFDAAWKQAAHVTGADAWMRPGKRPYK